jgi:hypothetical protein
MPYSEDYKRAAMERARECLQRTAKFAKPKPDAEPIVEVIDFNDRCRREATEHQEACQREDRRARAEEIIRKQRQQQQQPPQQSSNDVVTMDHLVEALRGVNMMGEACNAQFDMMSDTILKLRDMLMISETKYAEAEQRARAMQAELSRTVTAQAVLKSDLADLKVELRQAICDRRIVEAPSSLRNVN